LSTKWGEHGTKNVGFGTSGKVREERIPAKGWLHIHEASMERGDTRLFRKTTEKVKRTRLKEGKQAMLTG
jgi:hypothetical protein